MTSGGTNYSLPLRAAALAMRVFMQADRAARPMRTVTTVDGVRMRCDTRDFVPRRIAYFKEYEHELTEVFRQSVRPGDVVVDVGANVGYFTLLAGRLVGPDGEVVAIEADPATHAKLVENIALNDGLPVTTRQVAVTAEPCRVGVSVRDPKNLGASQIVLDGDQGSVEGLPLDAVLGDTLHRATFIKVDVEGAEAPLLDVLLDQLPALSPRLTIAVEVDPVNRHYIERFKAAGFTARTLSNPYDIEHYIARAWGSGAPSPVASEIGDYVLTRATSQVVD